MEWYKARPEAKGFDKNGIFWDVFSLDWLFAQSSWKSNYLQFNIKLSRYLHYEKEDGKF